MKNMPNMPATDTTWMRFAPETWRERKIRSGMSGLRAVASRTRKAASSASETRHERERAAVAPAVLGGGVDDRVDEQHERGRHEHGAEDVRAAARSRVPRSRSSRRIASTAVTIAIGTFT